MQIAPLQRAAGREVLLLQVVRAVCNVSCSADHRWPYVGLHKM